jgi:APA family basic amino acid/polyamine antiporter
MVLLATQRFEELMNYTSAAMLITGTLTVLSVIILRRKLPTAERPYRAWGYPLPPLLYAASSVIVLAILLRDLDPSVFLGGGWFVLALLFHHIVLRRRETGRGELG